MYFGVYCDYQVSFFLDYSLIFALLQLGDPENKAASNADFHLSKLLSDHPNMKVST